MEISTGMTIGLGLGTVFICLVLLVIICYLMSAIVKLFKKEEKEAVTQSKAPATIPNKGELVAAIAVAIAEDLGTEVSGIRIKSIKKI